MEASLSEMPQSHWLSRAAFPVVSLCAFSCLGLLGWAVSTGNLWLIIPLALLTSHFMHGQLIGFHEASHGLLRKSRQLNEIDGILIGIFSFTSFSLYRAAHQTHHMHLSTERDEEFWPFVEPGTPRWARVLFAILELSCGLVFTPMVFLRTFLRKNSPIRAARVRRRIWQELLLMALVWAAVLLTVAHFNLWPYFLWLYLVPAWIAGNLQSWRKYIEHVGLTGETTNACTRNIVSQTWLGKVVAFTLLHEPFHGVHHQHAGLGHAELPLHADCLEPKHASEHPPFGSYRDALWHLLKSLGDPRVGPQWERAAAKAS